MRLDNLAQICNLSTFINDPQQLGRLRDRLEMMKYLGHTKNCNQSETENKKEEERKNLSKYLPNAIMMHIQVKSESDKFKIFHT